MSGQLLDGRPLETVVVCHPERLIAEATAAVLKATATTRTAMTAPTLTRLLSNLHRYVNVAVVFDAVGEDLADLFEALHHRGLHTPVLIVTDEATPERVAQALELGAAGAVSATCSVDALCRGVRSASSGNAVFPDGRRHDVLEALRRRRLQRYYAQSRLAELSSSERQALHLLAYGTSITDIASRMAVSPHTVRSYIHNLGDKIGVHGQLRIAAAGRDLLATARAAMLDGTACVVNEEGA
jgi:DNA-binding NarL/FixJ family response regulator